jgi:hypothetical protein
MAPKPDSDSSPTRKTPSDTRSRAAPTSGTAVVWPAGVQQRYGISDVTRWRWERQSDRFRKDGVGVEKLPPRDVYVGGRSGWRPETLEAYERAAQAPAQNA